MGETERQATQAQGERLHEVEPEGVPSSEQAPPAGGDRGQEPAGGDRGGAKDGGAKDGGAQDAAREQAAVEVDMAELIQAAAKRDEYLALAQRTQADFENYRRRVARETAVAQQRGIGKLARELLPALDNLDRALESAAEGDPLLDGVRLVRNELHGALARVGIESFSPKGERFDPAHHEAVAQQPVEGAQSGEVAEVYQAGYRMGAEVIRPARVLVAA